MAEETIGGLLAQAMAERGHTQVQAADELGVSRRTLNDWLGSVRPMVEANQPRPSWDHLKAFIIYTGEDPQKVATMCGYDIEELLSTHDSGAWLTSMLETVA